MEHGFLPWKAKVIAVDPRGARDVSHRRGPVEPVQATRAG
jgi:hypothetical protein